MRELHVVAVSDDGRHVVLATEQGATGGAFRVALDERLVSAVRGDLPRPGSEQPVGVTPKDIQARLRAGESVEDIAASAGVPVSKVERYAGPVLSERERILSLTRAGHVSRSRLGRSALPLGEAVDRHLADNAGVRPETITWTVRREEVGSWLVELSYVSQARRRRAGWRYDVARREVTPVDSASAALAHVEAGSPARNAEPAAPARREAAAPAARARPSAARDAERSAPARPAAAVRPARGVATAAPVGRVVRAAAPAPADQPAPVPARTAKAEDARRVKVEQVRRAKAATARRATADAARKVQADAARKVKPDAARKAAAEAARKAEAAAARKAAADAARQVRVDAARAAKADAAKKAAAAARKEKAAAARKEKAAAARRAASEAAREAAPTPVTPTGPPTLRVVGGGDHEPRPRRQPKPAPAAARTAPARAAGQRASVPGWADVLLSTAPASRALAPDPDRD